MRWLVEVSSLTKTDTQKYCVDAESWQRALQAARAERGEEGPMSGFSIELLEEGYRAVDPLARVRFVVKRAPDDMPVTVAASKDTRTSVRPGVAPSAKISASQPPADGPTEPKMAPPPTSSSKPVVPPSPSSSPGNKKSVPPRPGLSASATAVLNTIGSGSASASGGATKGQTIAFGGASEAAAKKTTGAPAIGSSTAGLPAVKLLASREQEPTESSPLTYREYAFALPPGTSENAAAEVLRAQLRLVEAHIGTAKQGKLVNLAAFDIEFVGKPPKAPLATLTWKDWKGEPVIAFPRRSSQESKPPRPPSNAPPSATSAAAVVVPAAAPVPQIAPPPSAPVAAAAPPAPAPAPAAAPVAAAAPAPPPAQATSPASASLIAAPPKAPLMTEAQHPHRPPSSPNHGMVRTPSGRFVRGRVTGDELITSLFESMHDLHFLRDALDGGQFCLALATEVLPARAALIHFFDIEKREWVVACTRGKDTQRLINVRTPEDDELLRSAARKRRAIVIPDAAAQATAARYQAAGGGRSLIIAPVMQAGRALGALEIINPLDGMPFTEDEGNAMTYIAEQYAEYLGSRGIVLDRGRIEAAAAAR